MRKNLLILGTTGGTGVLTILYSLERGHTVTAYARSPDKLPSTIRDSPNVTLLTGELSSLPKQLEQDLGTFDGIISILGPNTISYSSLEIPQFYEWLLPAIRKLPVDQRPYLLAMGTQSIVDPEDGFSLFTKVHILIIKNLARGARAVSMGIKKVFENELKNHNEGDGRLDWTLYRLNILKNDTGWPRNAWRAGYVARGEFKATLDKSQLADWLVTEAEKERDDRVWVRKWPALWGESGSKMIN